MIRYRESPSCKINKLYEWHRKFAWLPTAIGTADPDIEAIVWLEWYEAKVLSLYHDTWDRRLL